MDRTLAGCNFFRRIPAVFLFVGARDLWRHGGHLGHMFLQFRAAQCFRRAFVHAGCAFTQSRAHRAIFFSALDRQRKIEIAFCSHNRHLACTADQTSERHHCCAASVPRLAKMGLEFF